MNALDPVKQSELNSQATQKNSDLVNTSYTWTLVLRRGTIDTRNMPPHYRFGICSACHESFFQFKTRYTEDTLRFLLDQYGYEIQAITATPWESARKHSQHNYIAEGTWKYGLSPPRQIRRNQLSDPTS